VIYIKPIEPMNLFSQYFPIVPLKEEIIPEVEDMVVDAHYRKEKYKSFGEIQGTVRFCRILYIEKHALGV
jgi:hypothetical protein